MDRSINIIDIITAKNNKKLLYTITGVGFILLTAYMIWYIHRGVGTIDESFYLTIPHRLLLGDRLLIDEWHVSQFSSPLIYPLFKLYYSANGTEGVVLFFRYFYTVLHTVFSVFIFVRLREYGYAATAAALIYCHYTTMNVMALNYYTMSMMACTLLCLILFTGKEPKIPGLLASGACISVLVLSEPLSALVYFAYVLAVIVFVVFRKRLRPVYLLNFRSFFYITVAIFACAAVFFVFVFSRGGIKEYLDAIPNFLTDSEYQFPGSDGSGQNLFDTGFLEVLSGIGLPVFIANAVLLIAVLFDKKRTEHAKYWLIVAGILCAATTGCIVFRYMHTSLLYYFSRHIPVFVFGAHCWLCLKDKKNNLKLLAFYCIGVIYSVIIDIASDNSIVVTMLGGVISNIAVFILAEKLIGQISAEEKNLSKKRPSKKRLPMKIASFVLAAVIVFTPSVEGTSLLFEKDFLLCEGIPKKIPELPGSVNLYRGADKTGVMAVPAKLDRGPLKGLKTTQENAEYYDLMLADLDKIKEDSDGPVYVFELFSWMYLYLDRPYSAYSTWFVGEDFAGRQQYYWELHKDKQPEYVYVPKLNPYCLAILDEESGKLRTKAIESSFDCTVTESPVGYIIKIKGAKT